jgi:hypothetical protein
MTNAMSDDLSDLEIAVLCDLLAGPGANLKAHKRVVFDQLVTKPDIIVPFSTTAARSAKQATGTIPIVAIGMANPVGDELVASLARPGGNVTGTTFVGPRVGRQASTVAARGRSLTLPCSGSLATERHDVYGRRAQRCLLLAQSGHEDGAQRLPLSGVKRTPNVAT